MYDFVITCMYMEYYSSLQEEIREALDKVCSLLPSSISGEVRIMMFSYSYNS